MSQLRVGLLALLAGLVLSGGAGTPGSARVGASPHAPSSSSSQRGSLGAQEVAKLVASVNPALSESERVRIGRAVLRYSAKYALDPELVTAVLLVESSARPGAQSPKGALGLMQVMPHMIRPLGMAGNPSTIESNIEAGCWILAGNIRRLGEADGISAYFWGSEIRGVAYLERVRAARDRVRRETHS